ncbi:MAG TPA: condensation domain-containing protein, partial [Blastocatellia bacterium]
DQPFASQSVFALAAEPVGLTRAPSGMRSHALEIDASVTGGRLSFEWSYSEQLHSPATIERLAQAFIVKLRRIIEHCLFSGIKSRTPSDFPFADLSQEKLEQIEQAAGEIEDIYPLSPMQKGMLFHSLYETDYDVYCTQLVCELRGELNRDAFVAAWQSVVDEHPVLRTGFEWEGVKEPLQVVRQKAKLPVNEQVWRGLDESKKEERLARLLKTDQQQRFHLGQPPLMRLTLIDLGPERNILLWSSHHLLMDGWSLPIILKDVSTAYERLAGGAQVQIKRRRPYRDFIAWLMKQDLAKAESFWRSLLSGFAPRPMFSYEDSAATAGDRGEQEQLEIRFTEEVSANLGMLARRYRLTLGTILEGAWALLLSSYSGHKDILFGVVLSGRSIEMAAVESMVGLFINTLPVRAQVRPRMSLLALLEELQAQLIEIRQYEQTPLSEVQSWGDWPRGAQLFDSILVFENYPVGAPAEELFKHQKERLSIGDIRFYERSNYPLTITAVPGREMSLKMLYDTRLGKASATALLDGFQVVIDAMLSDSNQAAGDVLRRLAPLMPQDRNGAKQRGDFTGESELERKKRKLLEYLLEEEGVQLSGPQMIARAGTRDRAPLSFAQQRLWFLHQLEPDSPAYNIPWAVRITGRLDLRALELSFNEIAVRHEILRTYFDCVEGEPVQVILPQVSLVLNVTDLSLIPRSASERELMRRASEEARQPFDLSQAPLIRLRLLRLRAEEHALLLTMHHIISDGWSMGVFMREVAALYEAHSKGKA